MQVNDPKGVNPPLQKDFEALPHAGKAAIKEVTNLANLLASLLKEHQHSTDIQQVRSAVAILMARLVEGSITVDGLLRLIKASGVDLKLFTVEVEGFLSGTLSPEEFKEVLKAMQDDGLKGLMKYLSSRHGKGEGAEAPAGQKAQDVVTFTKGLDAILKSLGLDDGASSAQLNIPGGIEARLFAMLIAEGLAPGLALKLKKLYSRRPKGKGNKDRKDSERHDTHKAYDDSTVAIESEGEIKTADGKRAHCVILLELDTNEADLSHAKLNLPPVAIDYGGAAEDLKDLSFSFDIVKAPGETAGHGRGLIVIDLIEVGTDENGAPIYGAGEDEGWREEGV